MLYNIHFSPTGGTEAVANIIAGNIQTALGEEKVSLELIEKDVSRRNSLIHPGDIAIISAPSFGGRVPAVAASRLRMINGNGAMAIVVGVYGNRAYGDTLLELSDIASSCGFRVIAAISAVAEHSIVREIAAGRPDQKDTEDLTAITEKILEKIGRGDESKPQVPGVYPYALYHGIPLRPYAEEHCIQCGACAFMCPVSAIPMETPDAPAGGSCISCMRCVKVCPVQARTPGDDMIEAIHKKIGPACADRKDCELFL